MHVHKDEMSFVKNKTTLEVYFLDQFNVCAIQLIYYKRKQTKQYLIFQIGYLGKMQKCLPHFS